MGNYLKLFNLTSEYLAYANGSDMVLPNVSTCKDNLIKVYYNPSNGSESEEPQVEVLEGAKILCKYNIEDINNDSILFNSFYTFIIEKIEIDGVELDSVVDTYRFDTIGEHTVLFILQDGYTTHLRDNLFNNGSVGIHLTSVIIGNSITSIGARAFSNCAELTSITIPNSVTSIGENVFYGCSGLTYIICNAITAPTISNSTFLDVASNGTLTVPAGSTGYDIWMGTGDYYLGSYNWTKVEA